MVGIGENHFDTWSIFIQSVHLHMAMRVNRYSQQAPVYFNLEDGLPVLSEGVVRADRSCGDLSERARQFTAGEGRFSQEGAVDTIGRRTADVLLLLAVAQRLKHRFKILLTDAVKANLRIRFPESRQQAVLRG